LLKGGGLNKALATHKIKQGRAELSHYKGRIQKKPILVEAGSTGRVADIK